MPYQITDALSRPDDFIPPITDAQSAQKVDLIAEKWLPSGCKILVAEDNDMNRKYLFGLLDKWHIQYDVGFNGREAVALAETNVYDMILMDIQMPIMDGNEATLHIRNTANPNQNIPIVVLTASALMDQKSRSERIGMTDFLTKPFSPSQLLEKLNQYLPFTASPTSGENGEATPTDPVLSEKVETSVSLSGFRFDARLDGLYLTDFYEEDWQHAADMFQIFLNICSEELNEMPPLAETEQWEELAKLAHKLKPTFAMVGLTWLTEQMTLVEHQARTQPNLSEISPIINTIVEETVRFKPVLIEQLRLLNNYITSS